MKELWGPQLDFISESETDDEGDANDDDTTEDDEEVEGEENGLGDGVDSKSVSSYSSYGKNTDHLEDYPAHYPVKYTDSVEYLSSFDLVKACCPSNLIPSLLEMLEFYRIFFAGRPMRKSIDVAMAGGNRKNSKNVHLLDFEAGFDQPEGGNADEIDELCDRLYQVIFLKYNNPLEKARVLDEVVDDPSGEPRAYASKAVEGAIEAIAPDLARPGGRCPSCGCDDEASHYHCLD